MFDKIEISLDKDYYQGKTFVIESSDNANKNIGISSALINGKKAKNTFHSIQNIDKRRKIISQMIKKG